jgi:lipid-binding SYLF domain-containing protein
MTQNDVYILGLTALVSLALPGSALLAATRERDTLEAACEVLDALVTSPVRGIPQALLRDAQGIAIVPGVIKASLVIGGRHGHGVLLLREPTGVWGRPAFVTISGGGIGWQVGVQSTDLVLVFKTRTSLDRVLKSRGKVTLGADIAIAAGPIGRQAEAATDTQLGAEIYSYSRSRGLFVGLSLEGAALLLDPASTQEYYDNPAASGPLQASNGVLLPPPDEKLRLKLQGWTTPAILPAVPPVPPPVAPIPVPVPPPPASPPPYSR